jgi:hypothetical protein
MNAPTTTIGNVTVGRRDVTMDKSSHVPGVHEGNWPKKRLRGAAGMREEDLVSEAAPARSTGINPTKRLPIDSRMPRLTPP